MEMGKPGGPDFQRARRDSRAAVERVRRQSFYFGENETLDPATLPSMISTGGGTTNERGTLQSMPGKLSRHPRFKSQVHEIMFQFSDSKTFGIFILLIILLNTAILIAQTWQVVTVRFGWYAAALDNVFLGIYMMEIVIKVYVWRRQYFKEGWNVLDFCIVMFGTTDFMVSLILQNMTGFDGSTLFKLLRVFRGVRAFRALRVLRTIRFLATLQVVLTTLLHSIRSIGAIVMLIFLFMYMFAVVGRGLYSQADPIHFGNLGSAGYTLFQLLTLDDWYEIYTNAKANDPGASHIIAYLMLYIVMEYFIFLNLFVAVLVDNFQLTLEVQNEANKRKKASQEESDDEDYYIHRAADTDNADESIIDATQKVERKDIHEHYPTLKEGSHEPLAHYFRLLAALECNHHTLENQQRILDMMVEICNTRLDELDTV